MAKSGKIQVGVNEKLCKNALKSASDSMTKIAKYIGKTGDNSSSTIIGCVERLNEGFRDTKEVADLYKRFNSSLSDLFYKVNEIDEAFDKIDKVV